MMKILTLVFAAGVYLSCLSWALSTNQLGAFVLGQAGLVLALVIIGLGFQEKTDE